MVEIDVFELKELVKLVVRSQLSCNLYLLLTMSVIALVLLLPWRGNGKRLVVDFRRVWYLWPTLISIDMISLPIRQTTVICLHFHLLVLVNKQLFVAYI